jgi:uridine kinase
MRRNEILDKLNPSSLASKEDIKALLHQFSNGSKQPFFAYGLGEYVGISSFHKVSKNYVYVELDTKGSWIISKKTLTKLCELRHHMDDQIYSDIYYQQAKTSFVIMHHEDISLLPLLSKLDELSHVQDQVFVAMDGFSASGKTTLGEKLKKIYNANLVHTDDFFKKITIDPKDPLSIHGANIDFDKINQEIVNPFMHKTGYHYRPFDFKQHAHMDQVHVDYQPMLIIEGAYSMHPKLLANYDYKVFVQVSRFKAYLRIFKRNGFKRLLKFIRMWIPKEIAYVKAMEIKNQADLILKR